MKFALMYEMEMLRPWGPNQECQTYWEATEQVVLADQLGFDHVWCVEHHFLEEFSHSSAPEVWYGHLSGVTQNIRLGHGVVLLPYPFNHPIRVAERIAVLDILSNGRVDFGTGRSITHEELGGFGIDPADSRPMWDEALRIIPQMWQTDSFSHEGKYFQIPPRNVIPKPIQRPHPPIWMATTQPGSFQLAGERGIGVLAFLLGVDLPSFERRIQEYKQALKTARPVGAFVNDQVGAFVMTLCAPTYEQAKAAAADSFIWYMRKSFELFAQWKPESGEPVPAGYEWYAEAMLKTTDEQIASKARFEYMDERDIVLVGPPARLIEKLKKYEAIGVNEVLMFMQVGRIPHEAIMQSIRLIGEEVIPYFKRGSRTEAAG